MSESLPCRKLLHQLSVALGTKGTAYYRTHLVHFLTCDNLSDAEESRDKMQQFVTKASEKKSKKAAASGGATIVELHNQLIHAILAPPMTDEEENIAAAVTEDKKRQAGRRRNRVEDDNDGLQNVDPGRTALPLTLETHFLGSISTMPLGEFVASICRAEGFVEPADNCSAIVDFAYEAGKEYIVTLLEKVAAAQRSDEMKF